MWTRNGSDDSESGLRATTNSTPDDDRSVCPPRSALVLLAPHVHEALYDLRARHLRNLGRKMPSHVTVLFPFRNPSTPTPSTRSNGSARDAAPFDATFGEVRRFGSSVVWLQPEPTAAFHRADRW